ncbi:hypothetical protein [Streptomyces kanamyceticus]|uniref:Secreted protein n=1 Tax=Streptomyces kanamyceticus TaxID=1967 RepID=A0A5J6GQ91_STRKN|nr:hypothetical protein [Streptomyces kanamyceticus]QEU96582.1 hypothetical protein CP970_41615 [Streptomyces kanamyceticus]
MAQQTRSARLTASALALVVTVLAFFVPAATAAYGAPGDAPSTHQLTVVHDRSSVAPDDVPALRVAAAHRVDAHIPGPQPAGPAGRAFDAAPHRAAAGPDARTTGVLPPPCPARAAAAPRGPPHR